MSWTRYIRRGWAHQPGATSAPVVLTEHERLMRHTGRPECCIPEHHDALQLLGQALIEITDLRGQLATADAKLRHPAAGR